MNFVSSRGSVELERDILFIKNKKSYFFESGFARICWALLPPAMLMVILIFEHDSFKFYMRVVLFSIWTVDRIPTIYRLIFKTSYSKRIPVKNIASVETREDPNGLEVQVLLHLSNKRVRHIPFRKLEKQYPELLSALSFQPSMLGFA